MANFLRKNATDHASLERKWGSIRGYLNRHDIQPKELVKMLDEFEELFHDHCDGTEYVDEAELMSKHGLKMNGTGLESISKAEAQKDTKEELRISMIERKQEEDKAFMERVWKILLVFISLIAVPGMTYIYTQLKQLEVANAANTVRIQDNKEDIKKVKQDVYVVK